MTNARIASEGVGRGCIQFVGRCVGKPTIGSLFLLWRLLACHQATAAIAAPSLADLELTIKNVDHHGVLCLMVNGDTNGGTPFVHYVPPLPAGIMGARPSLVVGTTRDTKLAVISRADSHRAELLLLSNATSTASADFSLEANIDSCRAGVQCAPNGNRIDYTFTFSAAETLGLGLSHADQVISGAYNNVVIAAPGARVRSTDPPGSPPDENGLVRVPYSKIAAQRNRLIISVEYFGSVPQWVGFLALIAAIWANMKGDRGSSLFVVNLAALALGTIWWLALGDRIDSALNAENTKFFSPALVVYGAAGIARSLALSVRMRKEAK